MTYLKEQEEGGRGMDQGRRRRKLEGGREGVRNDEKRDRMSVRGLRVDGWVGEGQNASRQS